MVKTRLVHYVALIWAATVISVLLIATQTSVRQKVMLGEFDAKYLTHLSKLEEAALGQKKGDFATLSYSQAFCPRPASLADIQVAATEIQLSGCVNGLPGRVEALAGGVGRG